jgi:large subunit ribosomal protein L24
MKSIKSRKQRKEYFNAPIHKKRKWISSHLEENLLLKYDKRRMTLVKGDTIKVMRGNFKGHEGKITNINQRRRHVEVEGLVMTKADGKKIAKPIHASNLLITKLNLTDRWRRNKLEKNLSDDVKKEIEMEAKEQIIETEKQKKILEEEKRKEAEEIEKEEKEEPIQTPKEKKPIETKKQDKDIINKEKQEKTEDKEKKKSKIKKNNKKSNLKNKKTQPKAKKINEKGENK